MYYTDGSVAGSTVGSTNCCVGRLPLPAKEIRWFEKGLRPTAASTVCTTLLQGKAALTTSMPPGSFYTLHTALATPQCAAGRSTQLTITVQLRKLRCAAWVPGQPSIQLQLLSFVPAAEGHISNTKHMSLLHASTSNATAIESLQTAPTSIAANK